VEEISLFGKGKTKIYGFDSTLPLFKKVVQKFGSTFSKGGKRWKKVDF
jgi:hypothetical protein